LTVERSLATIATLMTLLVALKGKDGLVLAADSRGTFGDPRGVTAQNDTQQKAHVLSSHVAVLTAGAGEVGAMVIDLVRQQVTAQNIDGATPVLTVLRDTVRAQYNNWFPKLREPGYPPGGWLAPV
jgi:20S proteasome alpha/beta subunit